MKVKSFSFVLFFLIVGNVFAQNLSENQKTLYTSEQQKLKILASDVKIFVEPNAEFGGFHLYIRKKDGIESVLLTETAKDPAGKESSYAYRAEEYNKINGDEIRILDGKRLVSESAKFSLVDSTVEETSFFGKAFHIYIPPKLIYGYEWTRHGEVEIKEGTFVNIRSFEKPYADYSGNFMDSPFMFNFIPKKKTEIVEKKVEEPKKIEKLEELKEPEVKNFVEEAKLTDDYNPIASESFKEMDDDLIYSKGPETLITDIENVLDKIDLKNLDLVFVIDATGSMKNDMDKLKQDLVLSVQKKLNENSNTRIGLLFYRDYGDNFNYKNLPVKFYDFTNDFNVFQKNLNSIKILGREGGDVPEAVYEAIFSASEFYSWRENSNRQIILIGDAEPHPIPRGTKKYSKDFVMKKVSEDNIKIHTILLPKD